MSQGKRKSIGEKIVSASLIVGAAHLLLKFTGLIQAKAALHYLDHEVYSTIVVAAFTNVIGALFLIGEESIGPSFLPVFMEEKETGGEKAAFDFVNTLMTLQTLVLVLATLGLLCFPDHAIRLIIPKWTSPEKQDLYNLLRQSLVWLAPCLVFLSLGSTTYMLLNGYKKFFLAAFGDASTKICVIIALVGGVGIFKMDIRALYFGLLAGSVLKLVTHLFGLLSRLRLFRVRFDFKNPAMKRMAWLMLPLLAGILFAKFRDLFNNLRVLSHLKDDTIIMQANDLGRKLFAAISWLVPYTLQIALFPFLCELVDRNDKQRLGDILTGSCRMMVSLFLPGAVLLVLISHELSFGIFFSGKMELHTALATAAAMSCYFLVLPAQAVECVLMQGFFANRKMISVTLIGLGASILSVVISYVCIVQLHFRGIQALAAVALGFAISRTIKSVFLAIVLKRSVPLFPTRQTLGFIARVALVAIIVGGGVFGTKVLVNRVLKDPVPAAKIEMDRVKAETPAVSTAKSIRFTKEFFADRDIVINSKLMLVKACISGLVGGMLLLIASWALGVREPLTIVTWVLKKFGIRRN